MKNIVQTLIGLATLSVVILIGVKLTQPQSVGGGLSYRENTKEIAIITNATTTVTGETASVVYYRNLGITLASTASSGTVKFACSLADDAPTFSDPQSATNTYDYVEIIDIENGTSIDGDTGIVLENTTDVRLFEVNANNFRWCTALLSGTVSGTTTVKFKPADNQ